MKRCLALLPLCLLLAACGVSESPEAQEKPATEPFTAHAMR